MRRGLMLGIAAAMGFGLSVANAGVALVRFDTCQIDGGFVVPVGVLGLNPDARSRTAYDYVRDQNLRAIVESAAGSADVIAKVVNGGALTAMSQTTTNPTGLREQSRLKFKVVFNDGSYVTIVVNADRQNGQSEAGSERTAAGQIIPADVQHVEGTWTRLGGENLARMATHLASLGASMMSSGPPSGTVNTITCSGNNPARQCVVEHQTR